MNEKKDIQSNDRIIRQMMQSAKRQAPENLKHRIMQQIETESALTPQRRKSSPERVNVLRDFKSIFQVMYLLLFGISIFSVIFNGAQSLTSKQFIFTVLLIEIVFTSFWAITQLDSYLQKKRSTRNKPKKIR